MANNFTFNTDWFGLIGDQFLMLQWANSTSGGTVFNTPYVRDNDGDGWFTHFFSDAPEVNDALYIGFPGGLATGIDWYSSNYFTPLQTDDHTLAWEYWNGTDWLNLPNLSDGTNGFRQTGQVTWDLPGDWTAYNYKDSNYNYRYPGYWVRVRIVSVTNTSNGGRFYYGHVKTRPYTIHVTGPDDLYIYDIYNANQDNGWDAVEKPNKYTLIFKYGAIVQLSGDARFIVRNWDGDYSYWQPTIIFGTPEKPCFWGNPFSGNRSKVNDPSTYGQTTKAMIKSARVIFYTSWMIKGKYMVDYVALTDYNKSNDPAVFSNTTFRIVANPQKDKGLYDPSQPIYRFIPSGTARFFLCNFENDRSGGCFVTQGNSSYERCNFSQVQYILTNNYNSVYLNCYIATHFNVDPGREVILTESTIDSNGNWYGRYTPTSYRTAHYLELRDCKWPQNNAYLKNYTFDNYPDNDLFLKTCWTHKFSIKVKNSIGIPIENAEIQVMDPFGNPLLFKLIPNIFIANNGKYPKVDVGDDRIPVSDKTDIEIGDYIRILGEIMKVSDIQEASWGYDLVVERGQMNTLPTVLRDGGIQNTSYGVYKMHKTITTDVNGETDEYIAIERLQERSGKADTYQERIMSPTTIKITAPGYDDYTWQGEISDIVRHEIAMIPITAAKDGVIGADIGENQLHCHVDIDDIIMVNIKNDLIIAFTNEQRSIIYSAVFNNRVDTEINSKPIDMTIEDTIFSCGIKNDTIHVQINEV